MTRLRLTNFINPSVRVRTVNRHIPGDLMVSIFNLCDAQTIFNLSLVSKQFRELVLQIQTISIQIPYTIHARETLEALWPEGLLNFLGKLSHLQVVKIKFYCYGPFPEDSEQVAGSILRWEVNSCGRFSLFTNDLDLAADVDASFCFVAPSHGVNPDEFIASISFMENTHELDIKLWFLYLAMLLDILPNITEFRAVDSRGQGRMIVDGGRMEHLKGEMGTSPDAMICNKFWAAPLVKVPFSQHVLHDVFLHLTRANEDSDGSVMENFCHDDEEFYQVAARIILEPPTYQDVENLNKYLMI